MKNRIDFLGIPVDVITMEDTLEKVEDAVVNNKCIHHSVINAGKVVLMQKDQVLTQSVISADLINADGQSIVWAARFLGLRIPERVAGIDLMENLISLSYKNNYKCFFLGASKEVIEALVLKYSKQYSKNIIAGYRNGYFNSDEDKDIVEEITNSGANILFVAISSPKKEIFLNRYKEDLKCVNFIMGVGGSFDVIVGKVKRAPLLAQKLGLEWLYRFLQEPRRMWKRYLFGNVKFLFLVIKNKFF
jgi:N-acetylglucosaminyldiphosphoundecaprenol N-acetyl-beta-D-mannosaminyltransferase